MISVLKKKKQKMEWKKEKKNDESKIMLKENLCVSDLLAHTLRVPAWVPAE